MKKTLVRKLALARETIQHLSDPSLGEIHGGTLTLEGGPSCRPECPWPDQPVTLIQLA